MNITIPTGIGSKAVLPMPAFTNETMHHDFLALMDAGKTFDEFINDPANRLMSRQRVRMMQDEVYKVMGRANIFLKGEMI